MTEFKLSTFSKALVSPSRKTSTPKRSSCSILFILAFFIDDSNLFGPPSVTINCPTSSVCRCKSIWFVNKPQAIYSVCGVILTLTHKIIAAEEYPNIITWLMGLENGHTIDTRKTTKISNRFPASRLISEIAYITRSDQRRNLEHIFLPTATGLYRGPFDWKLK